ncbi:MAG TPA: hypothetical protein VGF77_04860 [Allosphingosinicella sp.]|jgi:hypothetical protein
MSFGGDPSAWLDLIDSQMPAILRLILFTWREMPALPPDALEDPTTEGFCRALRKNRTSGELPFRIDVQMVELDPAAGERQGRMDIVFSPMVPNEAIYFCLECKRLNVTTGGQRRILATEYVTQGMIRFVRRQYGDQARHGGMLGYVLDGQIDLAINAVGAAIGVHQQELGLIGEPGLGRSSFLSQEAGVFETAHARASAPQPFLLQHIFSAAV